MRGPARTLYRLALRLYPRPFRDRWGAEMERSWLGLVDGRGRGPLPRWAAARGLADAVRGAVRERFRTLGHRASGPSGPGHPRRSGGANMMERWLRDGRMALRSLANRPLFVVVAAGSLAIGIGANTAVFSVANAALLRPLPGIAEPDRVVELGRTSRGDGFDTFAWPDFVDVRDQVPALADAAAYGFGLFSVSDEGAGIRAFGLQVTPSYFEVMGTRPALGRLFVTAEEEGFDAHPVVVVSHAFWQERLGGDPEVVGSTLSLNRFPYTVVGVTDPEFRGHVLGVRPDLYVPLVQAPSLGTPREDFDNRGASWLMAVGKLADGASVESLEGQLSELGARLAAAWPSTNQVRGFRAIPLGPVPGAGRDGVRLFVAALLGMVALILLTTCANVAGMFLARAVSREREVAVRLALGAGRGTLVRLLTLETLGVFVLGGGSGVALGLWAVGRLRAEALPAPVPIHLSFSPDLRVLGFAVAVTLATGRVFGLLPAARATRLDPARSLRDEGSGGGRRAARARAAFAGAQVGLSLVVLVTAALFVRSLGRAAALDVGFEPRGTWVTLVDLEIEGYGPDDGRLLQDEFLSALREQGPVEAAALATDLPLDLSSSSTVVTPSGWSAPEAEGGLGVDFNQVSPGYFGTVGIPLLAGRDLEPTDGPGAPRVAVVTEAFVRAAWPEGEPLGRTFILGVRAEEGVEDQEWRVVGVVGDTPNQVVTENPEPFVYFPLAQRWASATQIVMRTPLARAEAVRLLRETILAVDPHLSLGTVASLEQLTSVGVLPQRIAAGLSSALGVVALLLSGLGVYGVVSFSVARQRREIGIRMALGADRRSVVRRVVAGGARIALPGITVGILLALAVGRALGALLLDLPPYDPVAFGGVSLLIAAVALGAAWIPARRAARVDPVESLRSE